ncbi:pyrroline-5-carboxylate reductase [Trueperella abortisuis]|uniref:Pyrroline-5-carboxylate reductase n=1 Tax=Trueperella abortisuis TaxID=445930 RepID=A0ABT9PIV7_9ACTO|nr:pyrroline-5-carboxylate reductase [Trueperella abortisuis]MDP9832095.1 pyrroline-5-carboxylate reductase [Trueperella abortisuis]
MIGFVGTGNMGGAILRGVLAAGVLAPDEVIFTRTNAQMGQAQAHETGARFVASAREVYEGADIVILAVKPHAVAKVLSELGKPKGKVIVSVAAGLNLATLAAHAPAGSPIVRVMPNVNSQIGAGMSALCANDAVTEEQLAAVEQVFAAVGLTARIAEKDFAAFSAIAGCSPAWTYTYIDALARGALAAGMRLDEARRIAAQAVLGSAQLVLDQLGRHTPSDLRDQVTSPGGTTIAGLIAMEASGFTPAVIDAVNAAIARDAELGQASSVKPA